jgi:hypothetical protein
MSISLWPLCIAPVTLFVLGTGGTGTMQTIRQRLRNLILRLSGMFLAPASTNSRLGNFSARACVTLKA